MARKKTTKKKTINTTNTILFVGIKNNSNPNFAAMKV
jgi:hypothetical protein